MRNRALVVTLLLAVPAAALALTVKGIPYPDGITVEGKALKLIGAGVREKWFMDVYVLAAYSESGSCKAEELVSADEPKYLRLDMLRDVSAERMGATIGNSFEEHMPKDASDELKAQRQTFQAYFKDECKKGTGLEFLYLPGVGTSLKQNGKSLGPTITGKAFADVLWDIYFGQNTCCGNLKTEVFAGCKR
jgi:hypothetical protein